MEVNSSSRTPVMAMLFALLLLALPWIGNPSAVADELTEAEMKAVLDLEQQRIKAIEQVQGSVIAVYGKDRSGGGSGVIIHPSGIALTNHHVIIGAGVEGWGGISDGKLYKWKLIGTDPGGDVSMIQLEGRDDFPWTPLGDSDTVRVGDWALAMGNPFILSEDQAPTVTLGIVSGIKRYQPGAGKNQLVYGNCIQVDSSINPGNSGGPLFNYQGEVIGINGRGSFQDRGRVNVGLGYAISANQIRNFIPELLATKLVEHATLDANFARRGEKVVCSQLNLDAPIAEAGLQLGDELLEFEGVKIETANQFTNLVCTIPEDWPVSLKVLNKEGKEKSICVRAFGLPYAIPKRKRGRGSPGKEKTPEQKKAEKQQNAMAQLLSATPGKIRRRDINRKYASLVLKDWRNHQVSSPVEKGCWKLSAKIVDVSGEAEKEIGQETLTIFHDGRFQLESETEKSQRFLFDGETFFSENEDKEFKELTAIQAKINPWLMAAYGIAAPLREKSFQALGNSLIDGSDKADQQVAWRMRVDDSEKDSAFVWIAMNRDYGKCETAKSLLKIASREDCDDSGVLFRDFKVQNHLAVPKSRLLVRGLKEKVSHRITLVDCQFNAEADVSVFDQLPEKEVQEEPEPEQEDESDPESTEEETEDSEPVEDNEEADSEETDEDLNEDSQQ